MNVDQKIYSNIIHYCLFFSLAFLLCTKNFTVGVVAILLITSIFYIIKNHKKITLTSLDKLVIVILSAYFIASIPIYFKEMETTRYFKGSVRYLLFIPIYLLIKDKIKKLELSRKYLDLGIFIGSLGTIIIATHQYYFLKIERVEGFLYSINFAYLSCSLGFLSLTLIKDSIFKKLLLLAFAFNIYSTVLTQTRAAIFAIPILLLFIAFFYKKENQFKRIIYSGIVILLLSSFTYITSNEFRERVVNFTIDEFSNIYKGDVEKAESSGVRLDLWKSAILSFKASPIYGQTFDEREKVLNKLYDKREIGPIAAGVTRAHAHNQYFEMLASYGILGIIAFIFLLFVPLIFFLKRVYQTNYALTGFIFVSGFVLFCMTEVPLEQNLISTYYGLMLVLLIHFTNIDIENKKSITKESEK